MLKDLLAYFRRPMGGRRGGTCRPALGGAGTVLKSDWGVYGVFDFLNKALPPSSLPAFPLSAYSCRDGAGRGVLGGHSGTERMGSA